MNETRILGGVDGTGPYSDDVYREEFKNSFVNKVGKLFKKKKMSRGPSVDGIMTDSIGQKIANYIKSETKCVVNPSVFLTGYSRGGAAVIHAAKLLESDGIKIEAMFLFDAVERTVGGANTAKISSNVKYCYHALRDPKANSRSYFSNTGKSLAKETHGSCTPRGDTLVGGGTVYLEKKFFGTHGAIGGVPQTENDKDGYIDETPALANDFIDLRLRLGVGALNAILDQDRTSVSASQNKAATAEVWNWMQINIHKHLNAAKAF